MTTEPSPASAPSSVDPAQLGYAGALAELEEILDQLERSDVDVDVLAAQVQRAALLIGFCRDRIGNARVQIERVVADLDNDPDHDG